ncbi:alpha/beta hydrolase [Nocardioides ungokensis]|uniref:alpha/beta hydrolase n=1 Tax=Nocardioides ungokensis TaxID=1643322 RepID=UPI0015DF4120|nr:alpha/beta hydrolase [Nocardioides ungokensis]
MRRVLVAVLVVAMLLAAVGATALLLLSSSDGTNSSTSPSEVPTTTPEPSATRAPSPGLARFYTQRLDWSSCRDGDLCARLTVPLDYQHLDGRTIDLALLKVPAQDPAQRIGSLVVNSGGPGAPGTDYAAGASQAFGQPLLDRFDIVGFDPRGTGSSDPVDCLSNAQLDGYVAADPSPDTAAERATYAGILRTFGRGCVQRSGDLAAHVSTVEAARDMDVLRAALGESRLTYFGASYGTKLGATYADLFPHRAGRLVLDGAVDLSIGPRELALEQAGGFETALRAYVQDCVDHTDGCFLGSTLDEGLAKISSLLTRIDAQPLPTSSDRQLQIGNAFYGIALPLYDRQYWYVLSAALQQAMSGDGSTLLKLSDLYNSRDDSGGYGNNLIEALYAISCLDDPTAISPAQVPAELPAFEKVSPTFGDVFAWGLTTCDGWQVKSGARDRSVHAKGAPPIVVIGTTRDPATPMKWAVDLAHQLDSGVLIRRDGDGHTGYHAGNECVDRAVEGYLIDGTVPKDGLSC